MSTDPFDSNSLQSEDLRRLKETSIHGSRKNSKKMHEDSFDKALGFSEILTLRRKTPRGTEVHITTPGGLGGDVLNI